MRNTAERLGGLVSGWSANVQSAVARLLLRILHEQNTATRVVRVERTDASKEGPLVFDLSVLPHQCYLANGLLVSNSDAFQILAVGMKRAMGVIDNIPGGQEDDTLIGLALDDERPVVAPYEMDEGI